MAIAHRRKRARLRLVSLRSQLVPERREFRAGETPALSKEQRRGGPRVRCRPLLVSSNPAATGASSEAPQTAAFIEKEPSRPVLLLIVHYERP